MYVFRERLLLISLLLGFALYDERLFQKDTHYFIGMSSTEVKTCQGSAIFGSSLIQSALSKLIRNLLSDIQVNIL